jgi:hypothetical protein
VAAHPAADVEVHVETALVVQIALALWTAGSSAWGIARCAAQRSGSRAVALASGTAAKIAATFEFDSVGAACLGSAARGAVESCDTAEIETWIRVPQARAVGAASPSTAGVEARATIEAASDGAV